MKNIIIIAVLVVVIGLALFYVYRAKKSGKKCIGCPHNGSCSGKAAGMSCACNSSEKFN